MRARAPAGEESHSAPMVYRILNGDAITVGGSPDGVAGTLFSGSGMEVVWVAKRGEQVDPEWFEYHETDVIVVLQGMLRVEFESAASHDRILEPGDALVLPPRCRCRAYRWPRTATDATVFLAAYPTSVDD